MLGKKAVSEDLAIGWSQSVITLAQEGASETTLSNVDGHTAVVAEEWQFL
jgi:hypothetical protein